ncbi:SDR family NAD(P)-dependent oxidoreductase [Rhodococcus koreensis]
MTNAEHPLPDTPDTPAHRPRVLVTGVEQIEGAGAARVLAEAGCRVIAHSFSADAADAVATEITEAGGTAYPAVADLTIEADVDRLFAGLEDRHGGIDSLMHTAWLPGPETATNNLADIAPADWGRFTYDHMAMLFLTHAALRRRCSTTPPLAPSSPSPVWEQGLRSTTCPRVRPEMRSTAPSNHSP